MTISKNAKLVTGVGLLLAGAYLYWMSTPNGAATTAKTGTGFNFSGSKLEKKNMVGFVKDNEVAVGSKFS